MISSRLRKSCKDLDLSEISSIFAPKTKNMEEENRYPVFEEEDGISKCCEPPVGYAATGSGFAHTLSDEDGMLPDDYDPGIGPYSMEELNARIDEAEVYIAQAERGDWSNWVTNEEMDAELYSKYPWLR